MLENIPDSPSISTSSLTQTGSTRASTLEEMSIPSNTFDFENFAELYVSDKPLPDNESGHSSKIDSSADVSDHLDLSDGNRSNSASFIFHMPKTNSPTTTNIRFLSQSSQSIPLTASDQDDDQAYLADLSEESSTTTTKIPSMIPPHVKSESPKMKLFFDPSDFCDVVAIVDSNLERNATDEDEENHQKKLVRNTHPRSRISSNSCNNQTTKNSTKACHLFNTFNMPKKPGTLSSEILVAPDSTATDEPSTEAADKQKVRKSDRFLGKFPTREDYEVFHKHQTIHPKLCEPVRYRVIIGAGVEALFEFDSRYPAGRLEEFAYHRVTGYLEITKGQWEHLIKQWNWNMEEDYGEDEHGEPIIIDFDDKKETKRVINENRKLT